MGSREIGVIVNGATSRIGSTQHLRNALVPMIKEGGVQVGDTRLIPKLLLCGSNDERLSRVAASCGLTDWTTDVDAALSDSRYEIFFDAGVTSRREELLSAALDAGKHIYAEKPVVRLMDRGIALLRRAETLGLRHGVVEDKLALPGLRKLAYLASIGFFGRVINFKLEFGWWVFDGFEMECQRPSWNYQRARGGGAISDMHPHWRYVIEGILGPIERVATVAWTGTPRRRDEQGSAYDVDVEDGSTSLAVLENGVTGTIFSSWSTRVRRDEPLLFQVDGSHGSASAGLHDCFIQPLAQTPKVRWSPDEGVDVDHFANWSLMPDLTPPQSGYRAGWEGYLAHVADGRPFGSDLRAGLRDVLLAEACLMSDRTRAWVDLAALAPSLAATES